MFGTVGFLVNKEMDQQKSKGKDFNHPYFQAATMFIGESFCFIVYHLFIKSKSNQKETLKASPLLKRKDTLYNKLGSFIFIIPAFFDLMGSTLSFIGLVFSAASVAQMLSSASIAIVAINSVVILKRKIFRHQVLGGIITTIGVVIVGITSILFQAPSAPNPALGIVLLMIGELFGGWNLVSEELLMMKINTDPMLAIGTEGICGLGLYLILLPILYVIPCNLDICVNGRVEDTPFAFEQISSNNLLLFAWIGTIFTAASYNWCGISTTRYVGSLTRCVISTARNVLVWLISILLGWEVFLWPQLIGFVLLAFGTLLYNEIIILPCWGFKEAVNNHRIDRENINKQYTENSSDKTYDTIHSTNDEIKDEKVSIN